VSEADIAAALSQAMSTEDRRRELASQTPGLGPVLPLPQSPSGPGVGLSDMDLPVVGEGYDMTAEISAAVHKAFGPGRPTYAHPLVGGADYADSTHQPVLRHVSNLGDSLLFEPGRDGRQAAGAAVVISPQAAPRPSLLSRLLGRLRRR
jgi:hypothetical protein